MGKTSKRSRQGHERRATKRDTKRAYIRTQSVTTCPETGKSCFVTRSDARRCMKVQFPSESMSVYRCKDCGYWHIGHTPAVIKRGVKARADFGS